MTPKMGPLFESSLTSRGVQMRNDYGRDFFLDVSTTPLIFLSDLSTIKNQSSFSPFELRSFSDQMFSESNIGLTSKLIFRTSNLMLVIATWKLPRLSIISFTLLNASSAILYALEESFFSSYKKTEKLRAKPSLFEF